MAAKIDSAASLSQNPSSFSSTTFVLCRNSLFNLSASSFANFVFSSSLIRYATLISLLSLCCVGLWDGAGDSCKEWVGSFFSAKGSTSLKRISSRWGENSVRGMPRSLERNPDSRDVERPERLKREPLLRRRGVVCRCLGSVPRIACSGRYSFPVPLWS